MEYITDFPSEQAEALQKHLKELDEQGKLKEEFLKHYQNNMGKPNSLANYIDKNWETRGKKLYMEYTGIEVYTEDKERIKTIGLRLNEVSYGISKRDFLWKCSTCGNEWVARLNSRTNMQDCPKCGRLRTIEASHLRGETLEHWCSTQGAYGAKIKSEFVGKLEDGTPISINKISKGSSKKIYWKCSNPNCNNEWTASPKGRTDKIKRGCPACSSNISRLIKGVNDLETFCNQHPEFSYILDEFVGEDENHNKILPSEISRGNGLKVGWKCSKCENIWYASISGRTNQRNRGCPYCNKNSTSFPEQFIYHSLKQLFPNTKNRQKDIIKHYEYDIVIPELNLCIEYSGYSWHRNKLEHDIEKEEHCNKNNIQFLSILAHYNKEELKDRCTKNKIVYTAKYNKEQHIEQLKHIVEFILQEYAPEHTVEEIDFNLATNEANKIMGKA